MQYFSDALCEDCPEAAVGLAVGIVIAVMMLLIFGALYALHEARSRKWDALSVPFRKLVHRIKTFSRAIGLVPKGKLALTFCQVIAAIDSTYSIGLPENWFRWTQVLRFFGQLDVFNWMIPSACIVGRGMMRILLLRALAPLVGIIIMPIVGAAITATQRVVRASTSKKANSSSSLLRLMRETERYSPKQALVVGLLNWTPVSLIIAFCFSKCCAPGTQPTSCWRAHFGCARVLYFACSCLS